MKFLMLFLLTTSAFGQSSSGDVTLRLSDILSSSEFREYERKSGYPNRMDLFEKVFDRRGNLLKRYVDRQEIEKAFELLIELQALAQIVEGESSNAKGVKDLQSRQVRKLEIQLRRLVETINALSVAVPFEYRKNFEETVEFLERLRDSLLRQIFGTALGEPTNNGEAFENTDEEVGGSLRKLKAAPAVSFALSGGEAVLAAPPPSPAVLQTADRFTDEEYQKIQLNQELEKRVDVLLEIAESRLQEIRRRIEKKEWDKKEPNPLEFHTYWDMVHAYRRAIDTIMINIDEKAIYKTASEKDVRKSLEKLNEKIQTFLPQLKSFEQLAVELKDEDLYRELAQAQETSEIAEQGSLYGLGAPEK